MATPFVFRTKFLLVVFFACCCTALLQAQSLDIDYDGSNNNEKKLRIKVIKSLGAGVNSHGVVEVSTEALSIDSYLTDRCIWGFLCSVITPFLGATCLT